MNSIIFDIGGVVFNNGTNKFIKNIAANNNIDEKRVRDIVDGDLGALYRVGKISGKEFGEKFMRSLALKGEYSDYEKEWIDCYYLIQGTKRIIEDLRQKGYKTYYLSNNVKERVKALDDRFHFLSLFHSGVFAHELGYKKPSREAYEQMIIRLSLNSFESVYIDDQEKNLPPANEIGLKTIFFTGPSDLRNDLIKLGFDI